MGVNFRPFAKCILDVKSLINAQSGRSDHQVVKIQNLKGANGKICHQQSHQAGELENLRTADKEKSQQLNRPACELEKLRIAEEKSQQIDRQVRELEILKNANTDRNHHLAHLKGLL